MRPWSATCLDFEVPDSSRLRFPQAMCTSDAESKAWQQYLLHAEHQYLEMLRQASIAPDSLKNPLACSSPCWRHQALTLMGRQKLQRLSLLPQYCDHLRLGAVCSVFGSPGDVQS